MSMFNIFPPQPAPAYNQPTVQYAEVPPAAPRPRLWKLLTRFPHWSVEVHYALASWPGGDLDVDTEAELRNEMAGVCGDLAARSYWVPADGATFQRTARTRPTELLLRVMVSGAEPGPYSGWSKN